MRRLTTTGAPAAPASSPENGRPRASVTPASAKKSSLTSSTSTLIFRPLPGWLKVVRMVALRNGENPAKATRSTSGSSRGERINVS